MQAQSRTNRRIRQPGKEPADDKTDQNKKHYSNTERDGDFYIKRPKAEVYQIIVHKRKNHDNCQQRQTYKHF